MGLTDGILREVASLQRKIAAEEAQLRKVEALLQSALGDAAAKAQAMQVQQGIIATKNAAIQRYKAQGDPSMPLPAIEKTIREEEAVVLQAQAALGHAQQAHAVATATVEQQRRDVQSRSAKLAELQGCLRKVIESLPQGTELPTLRQDELQVNDALEPGQGIESESGHFKLVFQEDGNVVLTNKVTSQALWATNTCNKHAAKLLLQSDGNLVLYDYADKALWSSNTGGKDAVRLLLQNDGNLVLYNSRQAALWASNTRR